MKEIPISQGRVVLVDDEDFERVSQHGWSFSKARKATPNNGIVPGYAKATIKRKSVYLHRFILNPPEGMVIDHIDGNTLNNTKENLRLCTRKQNSRNNMGSARRSSPFKGVRLDEHKRLWEAQITVNGKTMSLGRFKSQEEAAVAYNNAAAKYFGDFAKLNHLS